MMGARQVERTRLRLSLPPPVAKGPFEVTETTIEGTDRTQRAMVITPRVPLHFDRQRLEKIRFSTELSEVERWLVEQAQQRGEGATIVIFRAVNEGGGRVFEFGTDLPEDELEEGGYVFSRALLPLHRRLLAAGVMLMVHTDWGGRPCYAMRQGKRRMLDEFRSSSYHTAVRVADEWILKHQLLHVALPFEHVRTQLLPDHLAAIERRRSHVSQLVSALPPSAID